MDFIRLVNRTFIFLLGQEIDFEIKICENMLFEFSTGGVLTILLVERK